LALAFLFERLESRQLKRAFVAELRPAWTMTILDIPCGLPSAFDFPVSTFPYQPLLEDKCVNVNTCPDAFVAKLAFGALTGVSITGIFPNMGGNSGTVTPTIVGSGFQAAVTAKLACPNQPDILGSKVTVDTDGRTITATFNLVGTTPEGCNVVVTNPDGTSITQSQGFIIEQGGTPDVWIDLVGWTRLRVATPQQYFLVYGNRGNVDAKLTRVWVTFPAFLSWASPAQQPSSSGQTNGGVFLAFDVSPGTGLSGKIPITLATPNDPGLAHQVFQVQAWKEGR
jgi:hypothetical protein